MFRRLISNLPFSPTLLPQVSFYAKRLAQEDTTRKLGMLFAVLTLLVQGLLTFSPPTPSLASSDNDVIFGGLGTNTESAKQKLIDAVYRGDSSITSPYSGKTHHDLDALFKHFNISEQDIRNSTRVRICSSCTEQDRRKHSVGRLHNSRDARLDIPLKVSGSPEQYYLRPLHVWDIRNPHNYFEALKVRDGVWIMLSCGNIVVENIPNPNIDVGKLQSKANNSKLKGGEELTYRIDVANTGNGVATDVRVYDEFPDKRYWEDVRYQKATLRERDLNGDGPKEDVIEWRLGSLDPGEKKSVSFKATLRDDVTYKADQKYCNTAYITFGTSTQGNKTKRTNNACIYPQTPPPPTAIERPDQPRPTLPRREPIASYQCTSLKAVDSEGIAPFDVNFIASGKETVKNTTFKHYLFTVDGEKKQSQSGKLQTTFNDLGKHKVTVQVVTSDGTTKLTQDSPCIAEVEVMAEPEESTEERKTAHVISAINPVETDDNDPRSKDVDEAEVSAGEMVRYQIRVTNTGTASYTNSSPYRPAPEDMVDVLEYANVIDANQKVLTDAADYKQPVPLFGGGTLEGGKINWDPISSFEPGETIEREIYIQVKEEIPSTNSPVSDPFSYDCVMSNSYINSDTVNINVDCPVEKDIEQTVSTLPNTGPGEVAAITLTLALTSFYLFSRNRQLIKELRLIQREYNGGLSYE